MTGFSKQFVLNQHVFVGVLMILFGLSLEMAPEFTFSGHLYAFSPEIAGLYANAHMLAGVWMASRRPENLQTAFLALIPIFLHLGGNITRIVFTGLTDALPLAALYALMAYALMAWLLSNFQMADDALPEDATNGEALSEHGVT
jgi:hypothetical protein